MIGTALPALPRALRASRPAARRGIRRDHVRLLVVDRAAGAIRHSRFDRLPEPLLERAYREAIAAGYLWHEFGDAALIV